METNKNPYWLADDVRAEKVSRIVAIAVAGANVLFFSVLFLVGKI